MYQILALRLQSSGRFPISTDMDASQLKTLDFTDMNRGRSLYLASNQMDPGSAWNSVGSNRAEDVLGTSPDVPSCFLDQILGSSPGKQTPTIGMEIGSISTAPPQILLVAAHSFLLWGTSSLQLSAHERLNPKSSSMGRS